MNIGSRFFLKCIKKEHPEIKMPDSKDQTYSDLQKIINQNPKALHDKGLLQSLLLRSYPNEKRSVRILLSFMECGVVNELQKSGNWISVDLNSSVDLLEDFAMRLADACKKNTGLTEGGIDISLAGFGIGLSGTKTERDAVSKIESLLEYAKKECEIYDYLTKSYRFSAKRHHRCRQADQCHSFHLSLLI